MSDTNTPAATERRAGEIDSEAVEAVARAISHVRLEFYEEPLGMNATRADVDNIARAAIAAIPTRTPAAAERIAALESALRPFSEALGDIAGPDKDRWPDDSTIEFDGFPEYITVGDLRRARAALSPGGGR